MDIHARVVAVLHIVCGALGTAMMLLAAFAVNHVTDFGAAPLPGLVAGLGTAIFLVLGALAVADVVAGVLLLKGSQAGRVLVIVFSVLGLFSFPYGTILGIYALWALLRKRPAGAASA